MEPFESIIPTAIITSYPRIFTDIPYEKEIYNWLSKNCSNNIELNKLLAPELEARFKLTNKLIDSLNITQVLELASGYSSRGLIYSKKGYNYVEMDLEEVVNNKKKMFKELFNTNINIVSGNALEYNDYIKCLEYLDPNKELIILNEGLLRYLTFDEKKIVAENIYKLLKKYGGVWITCDLTPKRFINKQDKINTTINNSLNTVTKRNSLTDRFEDEKHIKEFFTSIGFNSIEIHKFIEIKDELKSFDILGIDKDSFDELLESAIVTILKV